MQLNHQLYNPKIGNQQILISRVNKKEVVLIDAVIESKL